MSKPDVTAPKEQLCSDCNFGTRTSGWISGQQGGGCGSLSCEGSSWGSGALGTKPSAELHVVDGPSQGSPSPTAR